MKRSLVLFDGLCNLCTASVQFIIKRDPKARFRFAALQSQVGEAVLKQLGKNLTEVDTILLVKDQKIYTRSSAALHIARGLSGAWPLLYAFRVIPKPLRDAVYRLISSNRYKWFGKRVQCMLPTPELEARFASRLPDCDTP